MAPSRRKGASRAASAAAVSRQWKVGDLVLAKVKGFPAWPAKVSEPEKWGYSADWKKVLVFFFGTQQIAFCNPADIEAFTEEKKECLLIKRHGKGADFFRAVHEIIDSYEKLKKQEQVIDAHCTDEVTEANQNNSLAEANDNNSVELFHKSRSKEETTSLMLGSGLKTAESAGDDSHLNFLAELAASGSENDVFHGDEMPSKEPSSNVVVTYSSRRKVENMRLQDCVTQRRVQPAQRSRSSRVDNSRLQNFMLPRNHDNSIGDMAANVSQDRTGRRSKRLRKSPVDYERHDVDSPSLVSNGSTGENDPETTTDSDHMGFNDGITVESSSKSVQPDSSIEQCEREAEFSQRLEFQSHAVIFRKKRKPNRKRSSNDKNESIARLDKIIAPEADMSKSGHTMTTDHKILSERTSKEEGDEHLPLVKRARIRMGTSPHLPSSAEEQHDNQVAEKMPELSCSISKQFSLSLNCEGNGSANQNLLLNKGHLDKSSSLDIYTVKKPQLWEVRKNQPFSSFVDDEAALPPCKRLHRALKAMSANTAEDSQMSSDGPAAMNTSINEYSSSSSGECFKVTLESKEGEEVGSTKVEFLDKTFVRKDALKSNLSMPEKSENPFEEVPASCRPPSNEDGPKHESCEDANEALDSGDGKHTAANQTAAAKDAVQNVKIQSPHLGERGDSRKCVQDSPGLIMHWSNDSKPESPEFSKPSTGPETQISGSSNPVSQEENSPISPQNCASSHLSSADHNCIGTVELCQLSLNEEKKNDAMGDFVNESGSAIENPNANSHPAPAKVIVTAYQGLHPSYFNSISEDQSGDKAVSTTQSSSSVTDGLDSVPLASPLSTSACNMPMSDNNYNLGKNNGCSTPEAHPHVHKPDLVGKWSSRAGHNVALASFEAILGALTRSKESIARATHIAIDCAKLGIAAKVVEILARNLETESSLHRKVDLFFLVDSISQCSRGMKGDLGGIYPSAIRAVLPRLLSAAAPPGSSSQENRRQCLKVLRVWQERRILPESIIQHHIQELDSLCFSSSSGGFSRSLRRERAFDDPIREMDGMVDQCGRNSSVQLPGFCTPPMRKDEDEGSNSDDENFEAVTPEHNAENPEGSRTSISAIEKHRHILEDVNGELEMEDAPPSCEAKVTSTSSVVDGGHAKYDQFEHRAPPFAPPLPKDTPPLFPSLPVSSPPPPPPSPPPSSFHPPSAIPDSAANRLNLKRYTSPANIKDDAEESIAQQSITSGVNSVRNHGPDSRDFHAHMPMQMPEDITSSYSSQPVSHPPVQPVSNIQVADGAFHKGFHLRPPHPAPSNQFSYVQADRRIQSQRDVLPPPNPNRYNVVQNTENCNFFRNGGRMRPSPRESGDCWRFPAPPFSGQCHPDIARRPYGPNPFAGPPREPALPNHRWAYPPWAINRREFLLHRPPPGGPIPVASRAPNFWSPR